MSELCDFLIFKYLDQETLFNFLKSRSKLTPHLLKYLNHIQLNLKLSQQQQLKKYCREHDRIRLAKLVDGYPSLDLNRKFYEACLGGHRKIVDILICKGGIFLNLGLIGACRGNHQELIDLLIYRGAEHCWYCRKSMAYHLNI